MRRAARMRVLERKAKQRTRTRLTTNSAGPTPAPGPRCSPRRAKSPGSSHSASPLVDHPKYKDKSTSKRRGADKGGNKAKPKLKCNECGTQAAAAQFFCTECSTDTGIIALCGLGTKRNCMVSHGARGGPKAKFDLCDHFASTRRTVRFS
jgi:hypothetical protein